MSVRIIHAICGGVAFTYDGWPARGTIMESGLAHHRNGQSPKAHTQIRCDHCGQSGSSSTWIPEYRYRGFEPVQT